MKYKVLISTVGTGSRLKKYSKYFNKSLITINNKPVISHIIDTFDKKTNFVIALGYKSKQVKDYLKIAHVKNTFEFVDIKNFNGPGSGLKHTLICCQSFLQLPFIFVSCDSYFKDKLPPPNKNWIAYSTSVNLNDYRSINLKNNKIVSLNEKNTIKKNSYPYTGICGINSYKVFWKSLNNQKNKINRGEIDGLQDILKNKIIKGIKIDWYDTGNVKSLIETRKTFERDNKVNILYKEKEAIYFVNNLVIKYSYDKNFIKNRVLRAAYLNKYVPKIINFSENYYSYKMINGLVFSKINNEIKFHDLLNYLNKFWKEKKLNKKDKIKFFSSCNNFYKSKTYSRVNQYLKNFKRYDKIKYINGIKTSSISYLLNKIDWEYLSKGIPVNFHGDLHFENILYSSSTFYLLDWRQDFDNNLDFGDIYYDLSKILHGLIISHDIINNDQYKVEINKNKASYSFMIPSLNISYEKIFFQWIRNNNDDLKKVKILTSLIYLNIAILHHFPYSTLLFLLGKKMLSELIEQ